MNESLLPINASTLERALESTFTHRTLQIPLLNALLWDPQNCPENLLPWLAWALSVDDWDSAWSVDTKRRAIANSVHIHRSKGTVAAIERVLDTLNIKTQLSEWFEYGGPPHTFRLTAWINDHVMASNESILTAALYTQLKRVVDNVKPVRSHYHLRVGAAFSNALSLCGSVSMVSIARATVLPQISLGFTPPTLTLNVPFSCISTVRAHLEMI